MKFAVLVPTFVVSTPDEGLRHVSSPQEAQGVMFHCPGCWAANGGSYGTHLVLAWFRSPPRLPAVPPERSPGPGRWDVSGTGAADLTLSPSVDVGCWHGYIRNGEATNA